MNPTINKRKRKLKKLTDWHDVTLKKLKILTRLIKGTFTVYSIKLCKKTKARYEKKLDSLMISEHITEGDKQKPKLNYRIWQILN